MVEENTVEVKIWGDFALFTRPEFTAEPVSYPVITPPAAKGILEMIYWNPDVYYKITKIAVLKPIRYISMVKNGINSKVSLKTAQSGGLYSVNHDRNQRQHLILKDVAYVVKANIEGKNTEKYVKTFNQRVKKGQSRYSPYLGTREHICFFEPSTGDEQPIKESYDLDLMFWGLERIKDSKSSTGFYQHKNGKKTYVPGRNKSQFFPAKIKEGIMEVPCQPLRK